MGKKLTDEKRVKKAYAPKGQRSQKMYNFRLDIDLWEALQKVENKGRFVNEAIRNALKLQHKNETNNNEKEP